MSAISKNPNPNPKPKRKKKDPAQRTPPRRRDMPPPEGRPAAPADFGPLGYRPDVALRVPNDTIKGAAKVIGGVAQKMGVRAAPDTLPPPAPGGGQTALAYEVATGLEGVPAMQERSGVTPTTLAVGVDKAGVITRGKRLAAQSQNLVADGRLFEGARFSFYFARVRKVYRRLLEGTPAEQLRAVSLFGKLDTTRFRFIGQMLKAREETAKQKLHIATTIAEQEDENAFHRSLSMMAEGAMPDAATLLKATRHADRVQEKLGLAGAAGTDGTPLATPADRRTGAR